MKSTLLILWALMAYSFGYSQKLNVEGDAKIRGLFDLDDGHSSMYIGNLTGQNTGASNIFNTLVGTRTGTTMNTGAYNTLIGALIANSSNNFSNAVIIGYSAGNQNTGENAVIVGAGAGQVNTGTDNVFVGQGAGASNATGSANTFLGRYSGRLTTTGADNLFLGHSAGERNSLGSQNSFLGAASGLNFEQGLGNTFLGYGSGATITDGNYNTFLGSGTGLAVGAPASGIQRAIAIGRGAKVSCSRCAVIGGTGDQSVQVGIGTTQPFAQLDVQGNQDSTTTILNATVNFSGNSDIIGVRGNSQPAAGYGIGLDGLATFIGVRSTVNNLGQGSNFVTYGGLFSNDMSGKKLKYGILGRVTSTDASVRYGVYGEAPISANSFAGYFLGNVGYTGTLSPVSDQRLKKNIKQLDNALEKVMALQPKTYRFRRDDFPHLHLATGEQIGFISQEVEAVLPELTMDSEIAVADPNNEKASLSTFVKTLNYTGLIPVLTGAIQEQQEMIRSQKDKIQVLQNRMDELEVLVRDLLAQKKQEDSPVILKDAPGLGQNMPNPALETTRISYHLPSGSGKAELRIHSPRGQLIRTLPLSDSGDLEINTSQLAAGVYLYSLVVHGQVVETKTMVVN